ncbi:hypothetical protein VTH06DRAFT_3760 [Thermothelomyces fergusii]
MADDVGAMDEYMFQTHLSRFKYVHEETRYLEILNYTDPKFNRCEQHRLDEFGNFLHRRGVFAPPRLPPGVEFVSGIRLILQQDAQHPETFTPCYLSLTQQAYVDMIRTWRLPLRTIETSSVVGPFFWSAFDQDDDDPHLQIIFRKSDVRKKGRTRGWELTLSHSFRTRITSGYAKGTPSSDIAESIRHLQACAAQVLHPLLLPVIILSHDLAMKNDQKQRQARQWLRDLETAVSMRQEVAEEESRYIRGDMMDLDQINLDLVECHSQVLWKRPQAYLEIVSAIRQAMGLFWSRARAEPAYNRRGGMVDKVHRNLHSRLDFYHAKLKGIENYAYITLERLNIQRAALYNIIAQKESKLNLQMAGEQRRLAHAAKRDSTSMKVLSLMGAIFLPATYLASIFGMTFFNFVPDGGGGDGGDGGWNPVSPLLWIYFAITVPLTVVVVVFWHLWDRRRERRYAVEDADIEAGIQKMESQIMATMRQRTMSRLRTWEMGNH